MLKIENWKQFFLKKEVTVHMFGTVYKPKITVHGQWTLLDACTEKKKKKKHRKCNVRNAIPKHHLSHGSDHSLS